MKNNKLRRILLLVSCAVLLISLSVGATLAYLTSQTGTVTNTFTVGEVKITLDEAKVDAYGNLVEGAARGTTNTYKLIPGHSYTKDPTVHVDAASENCIVFVKIENEISAIEAAGTTTIAAQMDALGWDVVDAANGIYCKCDADGAPLVIAGGTDVIVFGTFTLDTHADVSAYAGKTVKITGYAIQADGFSGKSAADVWSALKDN